jgi:hypothetical protein
LISSASPISFGPKPLVKSKSNSKLPGVFLTKEDAIIKKKVITPTRIQTILFLAITFIFFAKIVKRIESIKGNPANM